MPNILAFTEQRDGQLRRAALEVMTAAATVAEQMSVEAHALVFGGEGVDSLAAELGRYGAARVHAGAHDALQAYAPDEYASATAAFIRAHEYDVVLFPADSLGKDLAPRVAARLDVPLAADATAVDASGGELLVTKPVYAGKAMATVSIDATPMLVSLRPNVFIPQKRAAAGDIAAFQPEVAEARVEVRERKAAEGGALDVAEAPVVISGGRGLQGPDNWTLLEELRDAFGSRAALGASRAVVDAGWRPHAEQVGQTGKTVAPQLYIAIAISGAIQHLAGMRTAGTIVAINRDADAPIFKVADYGIVGDALEIVPRLAQEVKAAREG